MTELDWIGNSAWENLEGLNTINHQSGKPTASTKRVDVSKALTKETQKHQKRAGNVQTYKKNPCQLTHDWHKKGAQTSAVKHLFRTKKNRPDKAPVFGVIFRRPKRTSIFRIFEKSIPALPDQLWGGGRFFCETKVFSYNAVIPTPNQITPDSRWSAHQVEKNITP